MLAITSSLHHQLADEFNAKQNKLSVLRETARSILRDGGGYRVLEVSAAELADLSNAAQRYLDTDGDDDGEFVSALAELDGRLNPRGYGPAEGLSWRDSAYAERSLAA